MNRLVPQSTIATKMFRIETESQYKEVRMVISLSARVAQAAFCIVAIYSSVVACGALASSGIFLQVGVIAAGEIFKTCVCCDLIRVFGTLASLFEREAFGLDLSLREGISSAFQAFGISRDTANDGIDNAANALGIYDGLGKVYAEKITEGTLVVHHANPYLAKILNQRI